MFGFMSSCGSLALAEGESDLQRLSVFLRADLLFEEKKTRQTVYCDASS